MIDQQVELPRRDTDIILVRLFIGAFTLGYDHEPLEISRHTSFCIMRMRSYRTCKKQGGKSGLRFGLHGCKKHRVGLELLIYIWHASEENWQALLTFQESLLYGT